MRLTCQERSSSELRSFEQSQLAKHCRQLWQKLNSQPQEQAAQRLGMGHDTLPPVYGAHSRS